MTVDLLWNMTLLKNAPLDCRLDRLSSSKKRKHVTCLVQACVNVVNRFDNLLQYQQCCLKLTEFPRNFISVQIIPPTVIHVSGLYCFEASDQEENTRV